MWWLIFLHEKLLWILWGILINRSDSMIGKILALKLVGLFLPRLAPMSCHLCEWPRALVHGNELTPPGRLQGKKSWACRRTWNVLGVKHAPNASPVNTLSLSCSSQSQDSSVSCKTDGLSPVCALVSLVVFLNFSILRLCVLMKQTEMTSVLKHTSSLRCFLTLFYSCSSFFSKHRLSDVHNFVPHMPPTCWPDWHPCRASRRFTSRVFSTWAGRY